MHARCVYVCVCRRKDRFLTSASRILAALRLRDLESVCLSLRPSIWTYNASWPNHMWAPPGVFPGSLLYVLVLISPQHARCFSNCTLIEQIWNQWGLVVKRECCCFLILFLPFKASCHSCALTKLSQPLPLWQIWLGFYSFISLSSLSWKLFHSS